MVAVGQYWQSVKAHSGSVCLSYLAAQRRDCEESDAVNALASLSVGVLPNKRYNIHFDGLKYSQRYSLSDILQLFTDMCFSLCLLQHPR